MPLIATGPGSLSEAIKSRLDAAFPTASAESGEDGEAMRKQFADILAEAIVEHFKQNALVTGTSPSGPVTGTIS